MLSPRVVHLDASPGRSRAGDHVPPARAVLDQGDELPQSAVERPHQPRTARTGTTKPNIAQLAICDSAKQPASCCDQSGGSGQRRGMRAINADVPRFAVDSRRAGKIDRRRKTGKEGGTPAIQPGKRCKPRSGRNGPLRKAVENGVEMIDAEGRCALDQLCQLFRDPE